MEVTIKNVILYDEFGNVSGFAEFKIRGDKTNIKVRFNDGVGGGLLFSVVANGGAAKNFEMTGLQSLFEMRESVDAAKEIFVCVSRRESNGIKTLASGVVNQARIDVRETESSRNDESQESCEEYRNEDIREEREEIDAKNDVQAGGEGYEEFNEAAVPVAESKAVKELDEVLRKICVIDENGKGQCESCPYREHFFGNAEEEVVV